MKTSTFTTIGGIVAIVGSVVHLTLSAAGRVDVWVIAAQEGWLSTVDLRPDAATIAIAEGFWFSPGSFAVPFLLLGVVALHMAKKNLVMPRIVGCVLILWGLFCAGLLPVSGAWVFILVGVLWIRGPSARQRAVRGTTS